MVASSRSREPLYYSCNVEDERLIHRDADAAIEDYLDSTPPDSWPESLTVYGFAPLVVAEHFSICGRAEHYLELLLEELDEVFGDPDSYDSSPSVAMGEAARLFVAQVVQLYEPWACEKVSGATVNPIDWATVHAPHWLKGESE